MMGPLVSLPGETTFADCSENQSNLKKGERTGEGPLAIFLTNRRWKNYQERRKPSCMVRLPPLNW